MSWKRNSLLSDVSNNNPNQHTPPSFLEAWLNPSRRQNSKKTLWSLNPKKVLLLPFSSSFLLFPFLLLLILFLLPLSFFYYFFLSPSPSFPLLLLSLLFLPRWMDFSHVGKRKVVRQTPVADKSRIYVFIDGTKNRARWNKNWEE